MHLQKDSSLQSTGRRLSLDMQQTQDDVRSCQMRCAAAPCWFQEQAPSHAITVTERADVCLSCALICSQQYQGAVATAVTVACVVGCRG